MNRAGAVPVTGRSLNNDKPTEEQLVALAALNTPAVCNALEIVAPERRGYLHLKLLGVRPVPGTGRGVRADRPYSGQNTASTRRHRHEAAAA